MKKKVIAFILGGIGNQLFAYAAARRLSIISESELILDHVNGFRYDKKYQRQFQLDHFSIPCRKASWSERLEPFGRLRRKVLRKWNERLPFEKRTYLVQEGLDFDPRLLTVNPRKKLYLEGYWQSEDYFSDIEPQIRQDLRIKAPIDSVNSHCADKIKKQESVVIHVRFFDDPSSSDSKNNIAKSYYSRAINYAERNLENPHYFIFSDKPEAAIKIVSLPKERMTIVDHNIGDDNAYADLWLMSQGKHFIIANSTFSWWGAWLASSKGKLVIAPGYEKRDGVAAWGIKGLVPTEWVKL